MSHMNRSEALRCIQIAKKCIRENNITKATKFLNKSIRMYETVEAKQLLESLQNPSTSSQPSPSAAPSNNSNSSTSNSNPDPSPQRPQRAQTMPNLNRNSTANASTSSIGSTGSSRMSKDEEVSMIRQILRAKDYYSILGISRDADEKQMKKAYRKKALKCHPDRNKAPGAEEAFKKLSKAYDVLRDSRKRQIYDQYGEDSPQMSAHGRGAQFQQMTPDDIIRMFFGGDFGGHSGFHHGGFHFQTGGFPRRRQGGQQQGGDGGVDAGPMVYIMQLLPIILVFFTMILPSLMMFGGSSKGSSGGLWGGNRSGGNLENVYFSLDRHHPFTLEKKTDRLNTIYYVQPERRGSWGYQRHKSPRFEYEVESAYLNRLLNECEKQMEREQNKIEKIQSNKIGHKERQRLLKNLMKHKKKLDRYNNKQCNKLFEYVNDL